MMLHVWEVLRVGFQVIKYQVISIFRSDHFIPEIFACSG